LGLGFGVYDLRLEVYESRFRGCGVMVPDLGFTR
jgi:hypothetical protein